MRAILLQTEDCTYVDKDSGQVRGEVIFRFINGFEPVRNVDGLRGMNMSVIGGTRAQLAQATVVPGIYDYAPVTVRRFQKDQSVIGNLDYEGPIEFSKLGLSTKGAALDALKAQPAGVGK